jgi:hypothetical protein
MRVTHELWKSVDPSSGVIEHIFFKAEDRDRQQLSAGAELIWTVCAKSFAEAMTRYYQHMDWGEYKVMSDEDWQPYS